MVDLDVFVVRQSIVSAKVVQNELDRVPERNLRWDIGEDCMVMEEAADPNGCFQYLPSGHWILSRFVIAGVMGVEGSRFHRDTVGPELIGRGLIQGWQVEERPSGTGWPRAAVDIEVVEYWRTVGKRFCGQAAVVHGEMVWAVHCTPDWSSLAAVSIDL